MSIVLFLNLLRSLENLPTTVIGTAVGSPENSVNKVMDRFSGMEYQMHSSSIDRIHSQASTVERKRSMNTATPTGSLNKKRQSSMDSPSLSRNPLRKLSNSSSGHGASSEPACRSNSPELPAVHFFNSKMQNQSRPASFGVHNSMFDSLKIRGSSTSPVSPTSPKSTMSEGGRAVKTMASPTASRNQMGAVHSLRKVHSEPSCKPPAVPLPSNSPPYTRPAPPVYRCVSPPLKSPLKKVAEDDILEDSITTNTEGKSNSVKQFLPKTVLPNSGNCSSPLEESLYSQLADCTSRPPPVPQSSYRPKSTSEDKFVTGIYREPIDKSRTPSMRSKDTADKCNSASSSLKSYASSDKTVIIHDDNTEKTQLSNNASTKVPTDIGRRSSSGSKESASTSSASTVTPTGGLVASIDGKNMSLLPATHEDLQNLYCRVSHLDNSVILRPTQNDQKHNNIIRNGMNHMPASMNYNNKEFRKSYPAVPHNKLLYRSPPRQRREAFNLNFVSDDEKDSISSRPYSDHSSIVFLSPIELKPSRNLSIRHLPHQEGKQNVLSYVFTSPYSTLDRFRSRSSDTINSIPHCPPTPKFPVPEPSPSLTQLLQELTGEPDPTDIDHYYDGHQRFTSQHLMSRGFPPNSPETKGKLLRRHINGNDVHIARLPKNTQKKLLIPQQISINPFQIKRRQPHSIPPRHCRSLDYIPSDREEAISSCTSSACGSPKTRHAYLMPLIFGAQSACRTDHTSLSSLASSSEMSQSDLHINADSASTAYESEYDNYRPGILSDEDFLVHESISDVDMEIFDDVNVDNVAVSDNFSLDMPVPRFHKKITEV